MILHQRPNLEQKRIIFNGFRAHNLRSAHKVFKTHKVLTRCTEQCTQETENASTVLQHSVSDKIALKYDPHHKLTLKNKPISIFLFSSFGITEVHTQWQGCTLRPDPAPGKMTAPDPKIFKTAPQAVSIFFGISTSIVGMRVPLGKTTLHVKFQTCRPINGSLPPI